MVPGSIVLRQTCRVPGSPVLTQAGFVPGMLEVLVEVMSAEDDEGGRLPLCSYARATIRPYDPTRVCYEMSWYAPTSALRDVRYWVRNVRY